jgi:AcrR family transcriptional regulator
MANRPRSTAQDWVEIGYDLLGEGGPAAVRVDEIARRLGVARSGFYHRFESRRALWDAINERWLADGMDAYVRAGALPTPEARIRGIGYFGLGNQRLRRADLWLLVRGPQVMDLSEHVENVRGRAVSWLTPHLVEYGFEPMEAERRALVYYLAYLGLASDLDARARPVDDDGLRVLVDAVVDVVLARSVADLSVDEADMTV